MFSIKEFPEALQPGCGHLRYGCAEHVPDRLHRKPVLLEVIPVPGATVQRGRLADRQCGVVGIAPAELVEHSRWPQVFEQCDEADVVTGDVGVETFGSTRCNSLRELLVEKGL